MSVLKAKKSRLTSTCFLFPENSALPQIADLARVQESLFTVALACLRALAQRGQRRCDLKCLGQHVPGQGAQLSLTSPVTVVQCREGTSSWDPGRAVHQVQHVILDDAQDTRSQGRQRICVVNIGDSGLALIFWVFVVGFVLFQICVIFSLANLDLR